MKEMIVCFTCILAMLAFILPGVVADSALNATNVSAVSNGTENISLNATENASSNTTENNATENVSLNATENATEAVAENAAEILIPSVAENATAEPKATEAPENVTQTPAQESTENKTVSEAPAVEASAANTVGGSQTNTKVLRAGFEKTKAVNNLDVYGNKSLRELGDKSEVPESAFNASQRLGNVSKFNYNTSNTKQLYNVSEYSRTKPMYQVPSSSSSKPVYDIEKYSTIKAPASIP
ncbi:MAG: hypothetical protein AB9879_09615 [Methanothrix sp.]